jgi:membrane-associated phospholipid phosphatase
MIESDIILRIQHALSSPVGRSFTGFCARWVIYLLIPYVIICRKLIGWRGVGVVAWTALLAFVLSTGLAAFIGRIRPYMAVVGVQAIVPPNIQAGSFPSSHTAIAVGVATALMALHVPIGTVAVIAAVLVAFGRIAAGMHYPSDVLGGIAVGLLAYVIVKAAQYGMEHLS